MNNIIEAREIKEKAQVMIEIPNRMPPKAWIFYDDQDVIDAARLDHNMEYEGFTMAKALKEWGTREDMPTELLEALTEAGMAIQYGYDELYSYSSVNGAPSEIEVAFEACSYDLNCLVVLDMNDAKRFSARDRSVYSGHQMGKAMDEVAKALKEM
mgnify:CR=1 FL=1